MFNVTIVANAPPFYGSRGVAQVAHLTGNLKLIDPVGDHMRLRWETAPGFRLYVIGYSEEKDGSLLKSPRPGMYYNRYDPLFQFLISLLINKESNNSTPGGAFFRLRRPITKTVHR